jgi:aldehyde:ferredoxin oxidoreductase
MEELVKVARRIQILRHAFNLRHGVRPQDFSLPARAAGRPPFTEGPLRGVTLDVEAMAQEYFDVIGWDVVTDSPGEQVLSSLGLEDIARDLAGRDV